MGTALTVLAAEVGRDRGRKLQPKLWASWGGPPTTVALRWAGGDTVSAVAHRHAIVQKVLGDKSHLPTEAEERDDPAKADQIYEIAVRRLRGRTRDPKRFPLLLKENTSYGFRRNLLGLRPIGIGVATAAILMSVAVYVGATVSGRPVSLSLPWLAPAMVGVIALGLWLRVDGAWLRDVAIAYADQLFEAAESLAGTKDSKK
jgi:hypothetical protein